MRCASLELEHPMSHIRPALFLLAFFTFVAGLIYPLTVTVLAQALVPAAANGSLIRDGDRVIGSNLIGQSFASPRYFHGRPSAAGTNGYDAGSSSGSNLGPSSKALLDQVKARAEALGPGPYPADLLTASASGLDPHISPGAAEAQIARVAAARGLDPKSVADLVAAGTEGPDLGVFGERRVNVLRLNMALDRLNPAPQS
jgi:K+-transporting ATPase ATPase C chain